jgi:hypothetical protein
MHAIRSSLALAGCLAAALSACAAGDLGDPSDSDASQAAGSQEGSGDADSDDALAQRGAIAVRPFTAEQIAAAMPLGSWRRYRKEQQGDPAFEDVSTVVQCGADSVTLEYKVYELDGTPRGEPASMTFDWLELRNHATWPAEATVIQHTQLELPAGTFDCWRYTVRTEEDGVPVLSRFYFAVDRPGAPVRYDLVRDGLRVYRMTLLDSGSS